MISSGCRRGEVVAGIATARGAVERPGDLILVLSLLNLGKLKASSIYLLTVLVKESALDCPMLDKLMPYSTVYTYIVAVLCTDDCFDSCYAALQLLDPLSLP